MQTSSRFLPASAQIVADLSFGEVEADGTEADLPLHVEDALGKSPGVLVGGAEDMGRKSRRGLLPDAGKPRQLLDQSLDGKGIAAHGAPYIRPGICIPPVIFAISAAAISWALRTPSFTAAMIRS